MSLAVLADHMASKGRGPDSMLIHMSPREVQGLQALAMKHGGSLTINPETGLPEAGFLDKLLPAIIGFALAPMTAGTSLAFLGATPLASAMTVGALQTLRTGDLGKGIMAGFGAYGGASLGANLATAGTGAISSEVGGKALETAGLTGDAALTLEADQVAQKAIGEKLAASTPFEKIAAGAGQATSSPEAMGQFAKNNWRAGLAAISPVLADEGVKSNMPTTTTRPGQVRSFSYNPYEQLYTPTGNYEVPVKAAGGGLMGLAAGGMAGYGDGDDVSRRTNDGMAQGGMYDFAQRSEPVVRMAEGGAPPAINSVEDLYTNILGRAPDAGGLAYWQQGFGDTIDANEIASFRQAAQAELANRTAPEQQILAPNLVNTAGATAPAAPSVTDLYQSILGRAPESAAAAGYWQNQFGPTIDANELAQFKTAAQAEIDARPKTGTVGGGIANLATTGGTSLTDAQAQVNNMYRTVLGRDADPTGLNFWSNAIASGRPAESVYQDFLTSARANSELVRADQIKNKTFAEATTPYKGYMSSDATNIVDEWVRTTLGREPTDADKQQSWYKDAYNKMTTQGEAQGLFGQFKTYATKEATTEMANRIKSIDAALQAKGLTETDLLAQTGKTKQQLASEGIDLSKNLIGASQLSPIGARTTYDLKAKLAELKPITTPQTNAPAGTTNLYGNKTNPGDITKNADGSTTVTPNIPYRPYGGFSGMEEVRNAYTRGGGSLGYIPDTPKTMEEFDEKYNTLTGGSKEAYDRLTGKTKYSPVPYTETGEVMKPYAESVMGATIDKSAKKVLFDPVTRKYKNNPDYIPVSYSSEGKKVYGLSGRDIASQLPGMDAKSDYEKWMKDNNVTHAQIAEALGISLAEAKKRYAVKKTEGTTATIPDTASSGMATGGLAAMTRGGMAQQFNLGDYSDGGRLLRGPGDGVSDSIPASIGGKRPARLADGEFVVPARIVSELGNGSTEAGARKLYAMMDRVQKARRGTVGKGRVAKNSRSEKYLPA
jgi:hypothetical protein